jgi:ATP-dependent DNA ligase
MLAKPTDRQDPFAALDPDVDWRFEPKWDGFRALVFKDGQQLYFQSRDKKPLLRYFPELTGPLLAQLPERCVLDGEIVIRGDAGLDFGALQMRLHPAASRVEKLSRETPAAYVAFDLLAVGDDPLVERPVIERRAILEDLLKGAKPPLYLTPHTDDEAIARDWFHRFEGAGFDGVIAKRADLLYLPKKRAMQKLKHRRTADCALAGFRWHKKGRPTKSSDGTLVGSLLLGLWGDDGKLHHVGITSSFKMTYREELVQLLGPLRKDALEDHPWASWQSEDEAHWRKPGMQSRWSAGKSLRWEPLKVERVVEVKYDQLQGGRFRHTASFLRFRDDKAPADCRYDQLDTTPPAELDEIFR